MGAHRTHKTTSLGAHGDIGGARDANEDNDEDNDYNDETNEKNTHDHDIGGSRAGEDIEGAPGGDSDDVVGTRRRHGETHGDDDIGAP